MKTITLLFVLLGIYTSFSINAKSQLFEYKCHVLVEGKTEAVIDVTTKKNSNIFAEKQAFKQGHKYPQHSKKAITKVFQCITSSVEFSSLSVRELDKNTLR
jgi:hypothetical protein